MPSINMIAARRAEKTKLEKRVKIMCLVALCELAVALVLFSFMSARIYGTNRSIHRLDKEIARLQPTVDKIHAYETEINGLEPRLDLLADSREATMLWSSILQDLSKSMPGKTWLTSVTTTRIVDNDPASKEPPKVAVNLRGTSQNQQMVGETMLRLGNYTEFDRVDLSYTQKGGNADLQTIEFDLVASLATGEDKGVEVKSNAN